MRQVKTANMHGAIFIATEICGNIVTHSVQIVSFLAETEKQKNAKSARLKMRLAFPADTQFPHSVGWFQLTMGDEVVYTHDGLDHLLWHLL